MRTSRPRSRMRDTACLIAVAVTLSACAADGRSPTATDGVVEVIANEDRQEVEPFTGELLQGGSFDSASLAGKVVVYNVWGSWCAPCRAEAPALVAASRRTAEVAVFVGLNTRDLDTAAPKAFVRSFGVPYVNLYDPDGALLLEFSGQLPASAIPSTLLVDPQGRVAARIIGETTEATLVGLIEDLS